MPCRSSRNNPSCRFAAPAGCDAGLTEAGVAAAARLILEPHGRYEVDGVVIHTAPADHGDLSPTALCLVLEFEGLRVLCTGDTAFRPQAMKPLFEPRPDVMLPCINGVFGDMGPIDAAMIVHEARPRYAIPCHFGMFAEQGASDPAGFLYASRHFSPEVSAMILKPGECFVCRAAER